MRADQVLALPAEPLFYRTGGSGWARYTGWDLPIKALLEPSPHAPQVWLLRVVEDVPSLHNGQQAACRAGAIIRAKSREIRGTWAECAPSYEGSRAEFLAAKAASAQARTDRQELWLALERMGYPTEGQHTIELPIATVTALVSLAAQVQQLTTGEV